MADKNENPFEDVERAVEELIKKQLELVKQIDRLEIDVTSWEADFLDRVIKQLAEKKALSQPQLDVVHRMCEQYDIDWEL